MQKKNSKLETFLYHTLPDQKYERIRGYESCIVVSEKENKSFKYVVLGDEWIYLTENPPKTIQEAVCLGEVISVELVNDFPDFLMGDDKRNSQHLAITYWTSDPVKRRSFRKKKSPRSASQSDLHGDRSNASTPLSHVSSQDFFSEDYGYATQSSGSLPVRPDSRGSVSSRDSSRLGIISKKKKKGSKQLSDADHDTFLKSLKEELEEDILEDIENESEFGDSFAKSTDLRNNTKRSSIKSARSTKSAQSTKSTIRSSRPLPESPHPNSFHQVSTHDKSASAVKSSKEIPEKVDLSKEPPADGVKPCCANCCSFGGKSRVFPMCGSDKTAPNAKVKLFSASTVSKPMSEVHIEITSDAGDKHPPSVHSSVTTLRGQSRAGTPALEDDRRSYLGMASVSDYGGSVNGLSMLGVDGLLEKRRAVLNLYLLSNVSPMLMLIRSAWSTYLLTSTLMLNPDMIQTPKGSVMRASQTQREKTALLFHQLKQELLNPDNTMEQIYELLDELKIATEKNFVLKRLFWKNSDMFQFFVRQLQHYLPKSAVVTTPVDVSKRADEFEFVTLLMELLCMMFHESEIIPDRTTALKAERGRSVVGLLMVVTCTPEVPEKKKSEDTEKLIVDFMKTSVATVFELFLMAKQANWGYSEGSFFNISWMVRTLEEIKNTEKFVSRLITMMMKQISPSNHERWSPEEAVLLYRVFFILETFLQYSPRIKTFIYSTYLEEFKYFVQGPAILKKLPQTYPLYNITKQLIEDVMNKVQAASKTAKPLKY